MENVKRINKFLKDNYGYSFDNKPKFRLVWSEDLLETRKGLFGELAIYEEIRKVPKYSFVRDRWVLEVYTLSFPGIFGRSIQHKQDIVMDSDGYEPLRIFQTKKRVYLKPDLEICKIICDKFSELTTRPEARRLTEKQANYEDVQKMRAEADKFFELLNADDSTLINQFHDGEAVIIHKEG
jgi:hypothetical protein